VTVLPDLVFQRVKEMRTPMVAAIADAFVVKHEHAATESWPRGIKTVVLMHRDVIPPRHLACPVVVGTNTVRIRCIEGLNQILAHQVSAIVGAPEALQRTILQDYRLQFRKNLLPQPAGRGSVGYIANRDGGYCCESDGHNRDANGMAFH